MIDISEEVIKLIKEEGFPALLIRPDNKIRCVCWDERTQSAESKCPYCAGTGYHISIDRILVTTKVASVPETLPKLIKTSIPASIAIEGRSFYLSKLVSPAPRRGDLLVVCEFRGAHPKLPMEIYEFNHVEAYKSNGGKTQYYRASSSLDPIDSNIKGVVIRKLQGRSSYLPVYN